MPKYRLIIRTKSNPIPYVSSAMTLSEDELDSFRHIGKHLNALNNFQIATAAGEEVFFNPDDVSTLTIAKAE